MLQKSSTYYQRTIHCFNCMIQIVHFLIYSMPEILKMYIYYICYISRKIKYNYFKIISTKTIGIW